MKVGFTGSRNGMTRQQWDAVNDALDGCGFGDAGHHGDCVGADAQFHDLCGRRNMARIVHPPTDARLRANVVGANDTREPKTHFARNREIVNETDCLFGVPCSTTDQPNGGTWYTIHYAQKAGKPVHIFWPDGRRENR